MKNVASGKITERTLGACFEFSEYKYNAIFISAGILLIKSALNRKNYSTKGNE
jgi:hypothetical protein